MQFTTDYLEKTTALFKEAILLKKYKAMPVALAILVGIVMLPFALMTAIDALFLYGISYIFKIVVLPIEQLHKPGKNHTCPCCRRIPWSSTDNQTR